jgi:KTSC domain
LLSVTGTSADVDAMPSRAIGHLFYDHSSRELTVIFVTERRYVYADVPPDIYKAFKIAESRGTFFNHAIRDHYACREVTRRSDAKRQRRSG